MEHVKVCRICLILDVKMLDLLTYPLATYFENLMNINPFNEKEIPPYICNECAEHIHKFHNFKYKCLRRQEDLYNIIATEGKITVNSILQLCRTSVQHEKNDNFSINNVNNSALGDVYVESAVMVKNEAVADTSSLDLWQKEKFDAGSTPPSPIDTDDCAPIFVENIVHNKDDSDKDDCNVGNETPPNTATDFIKSEDENDDEESLDLEILKEIPVEAFPRPLEGLWDTSIPSVNFNTCSDEMKTYYDYLVPNIDDVGANDVEECCCLTMLAMDEFGGHKRHKGTPNPLRGNKKCNLCYKGFLQTLAWERRKALKEKSSKVISQPQVSKQQPKQPSPSAAEVKEKKSVKKKKPSKDKGAFRYYNAPTDSVEHLNVEEYCTITILNTLEEQIAELNKLKLSSNYLKSNYRCDLCFKGFIQTVAWENHKAKHDPSAGNYECPVCKLRFKHRTKFTTHMQCHKKLYTCKTCSVVSKTLYQVQLHQKWHKGYTYTCQHCGKTFGKITTLLSHVRIKHPSQNICSLCGYSFVSPMGLEFHMIRMHSDEKTKEDNFMEVVKETGQYCEKCDVKFQSEEAFKRHLAQSVNHPESVDPLCCRECGERWASAEALLAHRRRAHHSARYAMRYQRLNAKWPLKCQYCPEMLANARHRWAHFRSVHRDKKYPVNKQKNHVCEVCGKRFPINALLVYHMRTHVGDKRYKCEACAKAFYNATLLKLHKRTHTGERPFACALCQRTYKCKGARDKHLRMHTGVRPFECHICGKAFYESASCKVHVNTVHLKQPLPPRKPRPKKPKAPETY